MLIDVSVEHAQARAEYFHWFDKLKAAWKTDRDAEGYAAAVEALESKVAEAKEKLKPWDSHTVHAIGVETAKAWVQQGRLKPGADSQEIQDAAGEAFKESDQVEDFTGAFSAYSHAFTGAAARSLAMEAA
nr:hypothetical protein 11 [bacterium]